MYMPVNEPTVIWRSTTGPGGLLQPALGSGPRFVPGSPPVPPAPAEPATPAKPATPATPAMLDSLPPFAPAIDPPAPLVELPLAPTTGVKPPDPELFPPALTPPCSGVPPAASAESGIASEQALEPLKAALATSSTSTSVILLSTMDVELMPGSPRFLAHNQHGGPSKSELWLGDRSCRFAYCASHGSCASWAYLGKE